MRANLRYTRVLFGCRICSRSLPVFGENMLTPPWTHETRLPRIVLVDRMLCAPCTSGPSADPLPVDFLPLLTGHQCLVYRSIFYWGEGPVCDSIRFAAESFIRGIG